MSRDEDSREALRAVLSDPSDEAAWRTLTAAGRAGLEATRARISWLCWISGGTKAEALAAATTAAVASCARSVGGPWIASWCDGPPARLPRLDKIQGWPDRDDVEAGLSFATAGMADGASANGWLAERLLADGHEDELGDSACMDLHALAMRAHQRHGLGDEGATMPAAPAARWADWYGVSYEIPMSGTVRRRLSVLEGRVMLANMAFLPHLPRFSADGARNAAARWQSAGRASSTGVSSWAASDFGDFVAGVTTRPVPARWSDDGALVVAARHDQCVSVSLAPATRSAGRFSDDLLAAVQAAHRSPRAAFDIPLEDARDCG